MSIFGTDQWTRAALTRMEFALNQLSINVTKGFAKMANELDTLKAAVQRNTDAEESAIILLKGLKDKLDAAIAAGDPAALKALSDSIGGEADKLAAAVVANTPAA